MIKNNSTPKPKPKATLANGPQVPAGYDMADVTALQAMAAGEADEIQQKRILAWIINQAAGTYEFHFYPTERDTSFALGRCFVGQQIVKLLKIDPTLLRRRE